jgi:DNA processing protein
LFNGEQVGDLYHWVALSLAPGIGCVLFKRLVEAFGSPAGALQASPKDLSRIEGLGPKVLSSLRRYDWKSAAEKELRFLEKVGGRILTWEDEEYPPNLKAIYDPPPVLYLLGRIDPSDRSAVAVVGSRYPTTYGRTAAEKIAFGLGKFGITVVSGLARGVDSAAHQGALASGGRTLGVLGCGIDLIYPPENRDLFRQVAGQGAVLSEFPLETPPDSDHFPIRNRLISGISLGVVVVEATLRSGSLITARFALDQGREVYALPGNADSARSEGTNRLIKQGAKLVITAEDIVEEILPHLRKAPLPRPLPPRLSAEEEKIYAVLERQALHIDAIAARSGWPVARVSAILLSLELAGHAKQLPGMRFLKT